MLTLIKPEHGFHVCGWMRELSLNLLETYLFALIHSHTKDGGTISRMAYFEEWTGCKKTAITKALKHMVAIGLITEQKGRGNITEYAVKRTTGTPQNERQYAAKRTTEARTEPEIQKPITMSETPYKPQTPEEMLEVITALRLNLSPDEVESCRVKWYDTCLATGWVTRTGQPIRDWRAHLRAYARSWAKNLNRPATRTNAQKPSTHSSYNDQITNEYH